MRIRLNIATIIIIDYDEIVIIYEVKMKLLALCVSSS